MPSRVRSLVEKVFAAGDDLVGIALVADIPEQFVGLEVEDIVHRQRQLDNAEVTGQMTAGDRDALGNKLADLAQEIQAHGSRAFLNHLESGFYSTNQSCMRYGHYQKSTKSRHIRTKIPKILNHKSTANGSTYGERNFFLEKGNKKGYYIFVKSQTMWNG